MSKNITIQEGGVARQFGGVPRIRTDEVGGGSCWWVPEDETELTNKTITENGTYDAADDGVYGWDTINVNVPGGAGGDPGGIGSSIVGTDPDDGEEYYIGVDDNGELEKIKLPVRIEVITPPTKTEYEDGEYINPTGIVVRAYYADGTEYGSVLPSELGYEPEKASGGGGSGDEYSDGDGVNARLITITQLASAAFPDCDSPGSSAVYPSPFFIASPVPAYDIDGRYYLGADTLNTQFYCTLYNGTVYAASAGTPSILHVGRLIEASFDRTQFYASRVGSIPNTFRSAWSTSFSGTYTSVIPVSTVDPNGKDPSSLSPTGGTQTITVKWPRIGDRKELTATFDITVTGGSDDTHESGNF